MKSLKIGTTARFRIAAAAVFVIIFSFTSPAAALDSYDFGEVEIGSEANVDLDIENLSTVAELTFSLSFVSHGEDGFSLPSSTVTISAGGTSQVQVDFGPSKVGAAADTLEVYYKTYCIKKIDLQGTGIESATPKSEGLSKKAAMQKWAAAVAEKNYRGKAIGNWVQGCIESADNHGQAVRCVVKFAKKLQKERMISRRDAKEMREYAAKSRYHHKLKKHWMQKKAELRESRVKNSRRWSNWD